MAGTAESKAGATRRQVASPVPYLEYDEFVEVQIAKTRDSLRSNEVITALTQLAVLWVGYLLMVVILDHWVADRGLPPTVRMILLLGLIALSGLITCRHILWPLLRRINPLYAARVIEESESRFQGNLVNWIDLKSAGRARETSAAVRAIEKRAAVGLDRMDVDTAVDRRPLMRAAYALLGVVVLSAMYVAFSPKDPFSSVHRALLPLSATGVSTETTITDITPGDLEVTARSQVTVEADLRGKPVEKAHILLTTADRKFVDQPVEMRRIESGLPRFRGVLNGENGRGLLQDVDYRIVANDAQSETFHIRVIQPPSAQIEKLIYSYPAYMQLELREVPGPAVEAWEGTKVTFEGRTNLPVSNARLILTDTDSGTRGEEVSLRIEEGTRLSGSWTLAFRSDGTSPRFYHIAVKTADGSIDPNPVRIPIEIRADQRPDVALLFPTSDLEKPANAIIPLAISASDPDFQLRSLTLKSERNGTPLPDLPLFESEFPTPTIARTWEWDLNPLGLQPGERLQYWIEARDNRQPVANRTNTPRLSVLIQEPLGTEQQVQRDLADARQQLADDLAAAPPNPNAGGADSPESTEPPEQDPADPNRPPEEPLAQRPERNDGEPTESGTTPDRAETNDSDEQTEFQNQLERLLNREEREHARRDRAEQDQQRGSPEDDGEQSPSTQESEENGGSSTSEGTQRDNASNPSSTKSGRKDKTGSQGETGGSRSATGEPAEDRENDPADAAPPAESPKRKSERGKPDGESPAKGASQGSKQTKPNAGGTDANEHSAGRAPSEQPDSQNARPQTAAERKRGERGGSDSSIDPMEERSAQQADTPNSGDDQTVSGKNDQRNPAGNDEEHGPEASSRPDSTEKPSKPQSPKPESSAEDGEGSPAGPERNDGEKSPQASSEDGGEPSSAETPSKTSEPPSGERPPRPGQQSQSQSQPDKSTPSGADDADDSANQESPGEGESQQSGEPTGKQAKPQGQSGQQSSGRQGGSKSKPGESEPAASQSSESSNQQSSQSEPRGASKTSPRQGAGKQSSSPSRSSDNETTGSESGEPGQPTEGEPSPESGKSPSDPRGRSSDPANSPRKPKPESATRSGNSQGESSPSEGNPAPKGKQPGESLEHDDPPSDRDGSENSAAKQSKRPNDPSEVGNQRPKGRGRPQGQQSQQPSAGEQGQSSASDQGESGGQQEGAGQSTNEPGESQPTGQQTGASRKSPGAGQKGSGNGPADKRDAQSKSSNPSPTAKSQDSQPGSGESDSDTPDPSGEGSGDESGDSSSASDSGTGKQRGGPGKPGQSGGADGQSSNTPRESGSNAKPGKSDSAPAGGKPGGGGNNAPSGQAGDPSGTPSGDSSQSGAGRLGDGAPGAKPAREGTGSPVGRGVPEGDGPGAGIRGDGGPGSDTPPAAPEPKLDELKEASNLILQKLKGQLSRGEVDDETLQELGWKDLGQLKKFVSRLEEGLAESPDDMSPAAQARRRQFEEILKSLSLDAQTETRERGNGTERRVDQVDAGRRPVPSSLRERYEAYTRSLSKQGSSGKGAAKSPPPPVRGGQNR